MGGVRDEVELKVAEGLKRIPRCEGKEHSRRCQGLIERSRANRASKGSGETVDGDFGHLWRGEKGERGRWAGEGRRAELASPFPSRNDPLFPSRRSPTKVFGTQESLYRVSVLRCHPPDS